MPEWHPISSAPKDGTRIRVRRDMDERDGEWWGSHWRTWPWGWHFTPTHWQPLPAPPLQEP